MNKDQKLIAEAYNAILIKEEVEFQKKEPGDYEWSSDEFYDVLKTLKPGQIYSYKSTDYPEQYNHWLYTSKPGGVRAGIKRLYAMGTNILTDHNGKQQTGIEKIADLVPSKMSPEEYHKLDVEHARGREKEIMSYKYSH